MTNAQFAKDLRAVAHDLQGLSRPERDMIKALAMRYLEFIYKRRIFDRHISSDGKRLVKKTGNKIPLHDTEQLYEGTHLTKDRHRLQVVFGRPAIIIGYIVNNYKTPIFELNAEEFEYLVMNINKTIRESNRNRRLDYLYPSIT